MTDAPNTPVIVVENVWKRYFQNEARPSLRHEALRMIQRTLGRNLPETERTPFWALRAIDLSINAGEFVGVVGRNGAGKSTLLRLLCSISRPTTGNITVRGKFATLLTLGAGFSTERTGRENIFLGAAIQGISPRQIEPLIHDIIAFAELEAFIDLPVKRYSSGMTARLGFSLAIHTLPDIIFVDEILAVGDLAFQERCIERILLAKAQQRTLVFVSHSPDIVRRLCERTLWIDRGQLVADGPTEQVLDQYIAATH